MARSLQHQAPVSSNIGMLTNAFALRRTGHRPENAAHLRWRKPLAACCAA
ncbi:hypothetical protein [Undibacterium oligocarboniphilum]|uniref:Uncharacterized protein n=1 Tax=Undibacterium oligocarboniphilum TaxID=666702 RepID=A0A850QFU3_9BURK|nr:hypothetical protein [Undibacterium oligocarboniphilum]MBC3869448.1 hypothetical protein [Undibacterium oligocarboniphilum]NVO77827.1 hypothetical protein [Undibacterium oligocarboniphilum]